LKYKEHNNLEPLSEKADEESRRDDTESIIPEVETTRMNKGNYMEQ